MSFLRLSGIHSRMACNNLMTNFVSSEWRDSGEVYYTVNLSDFDLTVFHRQEMSSQFSNTTMSKAELKSQNLCYLSGLQLTESSQYDFFFQ